MIRFHEARLSVYLSILRPLPALCTSCPEHCLLSISDALVHSRCTVNIGHIQLGGFQIRTQNRCRLKMLFAFLQAPLFPVFVAIYCPNLVNLLPWLLTFSHLPLNILETRKSIFLASHEPHAGMRKSFPQAGIAGWVIQIYLQDVLHLQSPSTHTLQGGGGIRLTTFSEAAQEAGP